MQSKELHPGYWDQRYREGSTGWDVGYVSTPLKEYIDQLQDKSIRILVPGAGNGHEAAYLFDKGFEQTCILDFAPSAIEFFLSKNQGFPLSNVYVEDFFSHEATYDLILEQTFFCALHPDRRADYVSKMNQLLAPRGKIVGVLWDDPMFEDRPPYGGNRQEYENLFATYFAISLNKCYNSIEQRAGREFFLSAKKL